MSGKLSAAVLAACFASTCFGAEDAVAAITRLENDFTKAAMANAKSKVYTQKYVADDFIGGTSFGEWENKAKMLKDLDDAKNKVNSISMKDLKVTAYGNAGVARYSLTYDDVLNGEHRARTVLCTDTWISQGGAWKQVASHCSKAK